MLVISLYTNIKQILWNANIIYIYIYKEVLTNNFNCTWKKKIMNYLYCKFLINTVPPYLLFFSFMWIFFLYYSLSKYINNYILNSYIYLDSSKLNYRSKRIDIYSSITSHRKKYWYLFKTVYIAVSKWSLVKKVISKILFQRRRRGGERAL